MAERGEDIKSLARHRGCHQLEANGHGAGRYNYADQDRSRDRPRRKLYCVRVLDHFEQRDTLAHVPVCRSLETVRMAIYRAN